ncbi:MAG: hypothetical protein IIV55_02595 [Alistipes sp.]|nr:hypothetical protein [Alistipes sp.]
MSMGLKMKKISGEEVLEFIAYNIDGKGTCLVYDETCEEFIFLSLDKVKDVFLGKEAGDIEYKLLKK